MEKISNYLIVSLLIFFVIMSVIIHCAPKEVYKNRVIMDTTYNTKVLDSISYNINVKDSVITNIKKKSVYEIQKALTATDSDAVEQFKRLSTGK